jgi:hypothetical protein
MYIPIGAREGIVERKREVNNYRFELLVHLFLSDRRMDVVDSQTLDGSPPQRFIGPPVVQVEGLDFEYLML